MRKSIRKKSKEKSLQMYKDEMLAIAPISIFLLIYAPLMACHQIFGANTFRIILICYFVLILGWGVYLFAEAWIEYKNMSKEITKIVQENRDNYESR